MKSKKIEQLFSLLDDEDDSIALEVMAELLDNEDMLTEYLAKYQEHSSSLMRKRVHQLQSALTQRRRRRGLNKLLKNKDLDLIDGLIEVHLQWIDTDSKPALENQWKFFIDIAKKFKIDSLIKLSQFMKRSEITGECESAVVPENYCIGEVLKNRYGSSALLSSMVFAIAQVSGLELKIVRVLGEFAVLEPNKKTLLIPWQDWAIRELKGIANCEVWEPKAVLRFTLAMLFSHAVNSDSFRYIQTIAQAITGGEDGEMPESFPYPYIPAEEAEEDNENSQPQ